jgi:dephospho-CoA kinase
MNKKLKIAVTGGIGSGKSSFCNYLVEMNYPVINADLVAKNVLWDDPEVRKKIIREFGQNSYTEKGINTTYLAETVFTDENKVKKINSIVHPPTIKRINQLMSDGLVKSNVVFVEAALIYEAGMEELFDYVVLITADKNVRIERVVDRDNVVPEEVEERMENQLPEDSKKQLADFVFENNISLDDLKSKAKVLITILNSIIGVN